MLCFKNFPSTRTMDSSSSWIDIENMQDQQQQPSPHHDCCPIPVFRPNLAGPPSSPVSSCLPADMMMTGQQHPAFRLGEAEAKAELHRVLNAVQCSADFGIYFCESFRDPRRHYIDDYWQEIRHEAIGVEDLHKAIGKSDSATLPDETRARLHRLARLFERLARRIDRVVLA